jgi:hypothetical protein
MLGIRDAVFDCRHPASLARFWAAALDWAVPDVTPRLFFHVSLENGS